MNDDIHEYQAALAFPATFITLPCGGEAVVLSPPSPVPALSEDQRKVRVLDIARAAARNAYLDAKAEFILTGSSEEKLRRPVTRYVTAAVRFVQEHVRARVVEETRTLNAISSAKQVGVLAAEQALNDLEQHSDCMVRHLAEWGEWSIHLPGPNVIVTFAGVPDDAPELELEVW